MDRNIRTTDDVLGLFDDLASPSPEADRWTAGAASWWDGFCTDRTRPLDGPVPAGAPA